MSGQQFEGYMAELFAAVGYGVRQLGGAGDQGVDLLLYKDGQRIAVQCKNHRKPVGNRPIQEVYTGKRYHNATLAWVVAPAGYTPGAVNAAKRTGVFLYEQRSLEKWLRETKRETISTTPARKHSPTPPRKKDTTNTGSPLRCIASRKPRKRKQPATARVESRKPPKRRASEPLSMYLFLGWFMVVFLVFIIVMNILLDIAGH